MPRSPIDADAPRLFASRAAGLVYALLLLAAAFLCYRPVLDYPFVQDDWSMIHYVSTHSSGDILANFSLPRDRLLYRPLSMAYHLLVHKPFGPQPAADHALALFWLSLCAGLTAAVLFALTRDRVLALTSGFLYVGATPIHANAMMWAVGANSLLGPASTLAGFWLYLKGRPRAAGVAMLLACLFYEGGAVLPAVVLLHAWLTPPVSGLRARFAHAWRSAWPSFAALAVILLLKRQSDNPVAYPENHPYAVRLLSWDFFVGLTHYARWMLDGVCPWLAEGAAKENLFSQVLVHHAGLLALGASLFVTAGVIALMLRRPAGWAAWITLLVWAPLALAPFAPLVNHAFRYFLMYALTPTLGLALGVLLAVARRRLRPARVAVAAGLLALVHVAAGARYVARRDAEGLDARFTDGTCSLFHKARLVTLTRDALLELKPRLPPGAQIVFGNIPIWSFGKTGGPRLWTGDPTIEAIDAVHVHHDEQGPYAEDEPREQADTVMGKGAPRRNLDLNKVFVLWLSDGRLLDRTAEFRALWAPTATNTP